MEYRVNRRTGDRISVLGVGTSGLPAAGAKEGAATLEMALEQGINYFDLATAACTAQPSRIRTKKPAVIAVLYFLFFSRHP